MKTKQLNAFEIKQEITRIVKALENSTILINLEEFKTLDALEDKSTVKKLLLKEFMLCNEARIQTIKFLLLRYMEEDELLEEMEKIIKAQQNDNKLKLCAIEVISAFKPDWNEQDYDTYLEYDEELVQQETKELLESSEDNPEVQLDFLDFFSTIPPNDQNLLLSSLKEDQSGGNLANILVPVFLSYPTQEIGLEALRMLRTSRSSYAYQSLKQVYDKLREEQKFNVKKVLNELKLSGASNKNTGNDYQHDGAEFYMVSPDGEGNISLIYKKHNSSNQTVRLIGTVIDDYSGIRECLGFNEISVFEADFLLDKLIGTDFKAQISPEVFKMLLDKAEYINYKNSAPPYEYNCWKKVFTDIPPADLNIAEYLETNLDLSASNEADINKVLNQDFTNSWFKKPTFGDETEEFFNQLNKELKNKSIYDIDIEQFISEHIDKIFYDEEKQNWSKRLVMTAYGRYLLEDKKNASALLKITKEKPLANIFYDFVMKQTVFQYFLNLQEEKSHKEYTANELENILSYLETKWGFQVCIK